MDYIEEILNYFKEAREKHYSDLIIKADLHKILEAFESEIDDYWRDKVWDLEDEIKELKEEL